MCFRNYFCSLKNFISCADTISFLNCCKSSYDRCDCNGNDAPVDCRNGNEKQESGQLIRYGMWKAEMFDAGQNRPCFAFCLEFPGEPTINHVTDAAKDI